MKKNKKGRNPLTVPAVRNKILLVTGILLLIRVINQIPTPGVNTAYLKSFFENAGGTGNFLDMMTGGSLSSLSVLALNITPFITTSIIMELLSVVFKQLEDLKRDGKTGMEKFQKYVLAVSIGLSFLQALAMSIGFGRKGLLFKYTWYWVLLVTVIWTVCAGALAYIGKKMTDKKLGNGVSLILLCNILSGVVGDIKTVVETLFAGKTMVVGCFHTGIALCILFAMTLFVVYLQDGKREVPVTYAKKVGTGSRMGAMRSTLPIPVNSSSVIPVIFASSLFSIPSMVGMFVTSDNRVWNAVINYTNTGNWFHPEKIKYTIGWVVFAALILFFTVFYTQINFNALEISENLRKSGAQIPGIRPGVETAKYLSSKIDVLSMLGGIGMVFVATVPMVISGVFGIGNISLMGTSVVIIVGVIVETKNSLAVEMSQYRYRSFV